MSRVVCIRFQDWEALYLDGRLVLEALRIGLSDIKKVLPPDTKLEDMHVLSPTPNSRMQKVLDSRKMHEIHCPLNLTDFGEENINHVRV